MKVIRLLLLVCFPVMLVRADDIPPERSFIAIDKTTGAWSFNWWGVGARTYFILNSDLQLANWTYWPVIEQGADAPISYGFWLSPQPERLFLRLKYTDQPAVDPFAADFDSDGIPNGWEVEHGLDPFDAADASATSGGFTQLELYQQSLGSAPDPRLQNPSRLAVYSP